MYAIVMAFFNEHVTHLLSGVLPLATNWVRPEFPSPTCSFCFAPCASVVAAMTSSPCPRTPRQKWLPRLFSKPSSISSRPSAPMVMEPGSASRWKRKALKQGRGSGTLEQASLWDTAALVMEEQWSSSRRRRRAVQGIFYKDDFIMRGNKSTRQGQSVWRGKWTIQESIASNLSCI